MSGRPIECILFVSECLKGTSHERLNNVPVVAGRRGDYWRRFTVRETDLREHRSPKPERVVRLSRLTDGGCGTGQLLEFVCHWLCQCERRSWRSAQ